MGAGDPAAKRTDDGVQGTLTLRHFIQAYGAKSVFAVEDPWNPVAARVLVTAHNALKLFISKHGDVREYEINSPGRRPAKQQEKNEFNDKETSDRYE